MEDSKKDKSTKKSKLPYIIAVIAIGFTFLNWVEAYSNASVGEYSANYGMSFSAWTGGYGASALVIYIIGCILYFKNKKYYWLAGIIAIADGIYIYYALTQANVASTYDIGSMGGSMSAGYNILIGFYLFIGASVIYSLTALFKPITRAKQASFLLIALGGLILGCETNQESEPQENNTLNTAKYEMPESINGTYEGNTGGVVSTLTVIGDSWYGSHKQEYTGQIIGSGSGTVEGNKVYDEYGRELGYIEEGSAYVNLGGMQVVLDKR